MSVTVSITNADLKSFERSIKKYGKNVEKGLTKEIAKAATNISRRAVATTPRNTSKLAASYRVSRSKTSALVSNDTVYMPYIEFGTGTGVASFPFFRKFEGLRNYALRFKGKGLRKINREPHGMLYGSTLVEIPKFTNALQKLLKKKWRK
jgi:hypothetical protein